MQYKTVQLQSCQQQPQNMDQRNWSYFLIADDSAQNYSTSQEYYFTPYNAIWRYKWLMVLCSWLKGTLAVSILLCHIWTLQFILRRRHLWTATNILLLNISVTAICDAALNCVQLSSANESWIYSDRLCKLMGMLKTQLPGVFWWSIMAIAYERYRIIMTPTKKNLSARQAAVVSLIIWGFATIQYAYIVTLFSAKPAFYLDSTHIICINIYKRKLPQWLQIVIALITIGTQPMQTVFMVVVYKKITSRLQQRVFRIRNHKIQEARRLRVIRSLVRIVVVSLSLWLPHILLLMVKIYEHVNRRGDSYVISPAMRWAADLCICLNFLVSPCLYYAADRNIVVELKKIFRSNSISPLHPPA